jgi:peptidyl-prolyl cis-trans isomerase A (cyclophilin A)
MMSSSDEHDGGARGVADVELAPMGVNVDDEKEDDSESIASEESEFSNDEGRPNEYKPGAVRTMDQDYVHSIEQQRRRSAFCMALIMLALGVSILKFFLSGGRPSPPTLTSFDDDGAANYARVKFTVNNLNGKEGHTGSFTIEIREDWAPIGAERFKTLVETTFYDKCRIFRVLPKFVSQWGIAENPLVQAEWNSQPLQDDPVLMSNKKGTLSFATAGANTRTTQVFINTVENKRLDKMGFAPFGNVIEGMNIVDMFYSGYGEGAPEGNGPSQSKMEDRGAAYVDKNFPKLSYFEKVEFVD